MDKKSIILLAAVILGTIAIQLASYSVRHGHAAAQTSEAPQNAPSFPKASLTIDTMDGGKHLAFDVEIAKTEEQVKYGLMFRKEMPENAGMLFIFPADQVITMWMKNTLIPLDMLFLEDDGRITKITPNAVPESETLLSSDIPVKAVIELNGGVAAKLGIQPGDHVASADLGTP